MKNEPEVLQEHVSSRKPFGLDTSFSRSNRFQHTPTGLKQPIICYGKGMQKGYIERTDILARADWVDVWKVFVPRANNIGTELPDDNLNSFVANPGTACTESYIAIGGDLNLDKGSAANLSAYLRTKFARFMHSLAKVSQDATAKTYRFVPMPNLNESITDSSLYSQYELTPDEIAFVEETIQPMGD